MINPQKTSRVINTKYVDDTELIESASIKIEDEELGTSHSIYDFYKNPKPVQLALPYGAWCINSRAARSGPREIHLYGKIKSKEDLLDFIITLENKFKTGRVLSSITGSGMCIYELSTTAIGRSLSFRQAQSILRFENKAAPRARNLPEAVSNISPVLIEGNVDFDDYVLEKWNRGSTRHSYSYVTFDKTVKKWLDKVIASY